MNERQLREWLFTKSLEDEWYLSIKGKVDPSLYTLDQAKTKAGGREFQLLHNSQSELANPPWIDFESTPKTKHKEPARRESRGGISTGFGCLLISGITALIIFGIVSSNDTTREQRAANAALPPLNGYINTTHQDNQCRLLRLAKCYDFP
jgi:hypothetical protein